MEITLEAIISLVGLFIGGGGGAFFMWRYQRKKAKAEAVQAEVEATKEMQNLYQQMLEDAKADREDRRIQLDELRQERDHYKHDRNELRDRLGKMEDDMLEMKREINRNYRMIDDLRPFICGYVKCPNRQPVTISESGEVKAKKPRKPATVPPGTTTADIEPVENEAL